jgi:hypothetical protein
MAGDLVASAAMVGVRGLRGGLEGMTEQYAANLEDDLDWAMDWSRPDNDYSRLSSTWVGQSFMDGMYGGLIDGLNDAVSDMTWGAWPTGEDGGPAVADGHGYRRAMKAMQGVRHAWQPLRLLARTKVLQTGGHTIEKRVRKALRLSHEQAKNGIENVKKANLRNPNDHGHRIWNNGDVTDVHTGKLLGNLFDFL